MRKGIRFHIVDSVKGGSGKSTFALQVAASLKEASGGHGSKPIIVDVDILGTSWKHFCGDLLRPKGKPDGEIIYLNDFIDDFSFNSSKDCICSLKYFLDDAKEDSVDIIICNSEPDKKRKFKAGSASGYVREVRYSQFRYMLVKLIDYLRDEEYTDIIFDMPPNSDSYSDMVFDILLNTENTCFSKGDSVYLYLVSAINRAHILSNYFCLDDLCSSRQSTKWDTGRLQPCFVMNQTVDMRRILSDGRLEDIVVGTAGNLKDPKIFNGAVSSPCFYLNDFSEPTVRQSLVAVVTGGTTRISVQAIDKGQLYTYKTGIFGLFRDSSGKPIDIFRSWWKI